MISQEDADHLGKQLFYYRQRLAVLLGQRAHFGASTAPHITIEINDIRRIIADIKIKAQLRSGGYAVAHAPNDIEPARSTRFVPTVFIATMEFEADDKDAAVLVFEHRDDLDVEAAARKAVKAFLKNHQEYATCSTFDWGDAMGSLTHMDWAKYGLVLLPPIQKVLVEGFEDLLAH